MLSAAIGWAYQSETVSGAGSISGTVSFLGRPPVPRRIDVTKDLEVCGARPLYDQSLIAGPGGGIADAVVTLHGISKGEPMVPLKDVKFDQKDCEYVPHVIAFPAGSTIDIINSDGILHNIHTESTINPVVDMAQPGFKKNIDVTIADPEIIKVGCDAHNWMEGWWYATANPYYAVTGPDGRYEIKNVPPGSYSLQVWQEKLGIEKRPVTVGQGASVTVNFTMKAD
jgi:Carboxypeptidase regulatory-like domain